MSISDALIADFETEVTTTQRVLAAVNDDKFDWKPHEKSMSLGMLAGHIVEAPGWTRAMLEPEFDFADIAKDYRPFVPGNLEELQRTFEEKCACFKESFAEKDDAFMEATWTMKNDGLVLLSSPRHTAVRSTVLHHMIHHRGQLTVYLRLLDIAVPSTYGPTADNQPPGA